MIKHSRGLYIVLATAVLIAAIVLWKSFQPEIRVHKVVMPGEHLTFFGKSTYAIWVYRSWKSKRIEGSPDSSVSLSIVDGNNKPVLVHNEPKPHETSAIYASAPNEGEFEFSVDIPQSGTYKVSSAQSCVLVFVPPAAVHVDLGSNSYYDSQDNDSNFD